ncbi:MAG: mandelate racemase/muconate lactonizing enzyme family protein [Oscillospiraceae bacterium]|nr:mandelate racemase/muconate lactonizing enzyme family protein [Oscillospiraceae bacterium]
MKITDVKTFLVDGGFRPWTFVKIETDEGVTGWGDCTDWGSPEPVVAMVHRLGRFIIGRDPLNSEAIWWELSAFCVRHAFGIAHKAIAGIDSALWDIRGKAYGVPVYQLLGGKLRDRLPLYWTHFGTMRVQFPDVIGQEPLKSPSDLAALCKEAKGCGYTAVKTNMAVAKALGFDVPPLNFDFPRDGMRSLIRAVSTQMEFIGQELGPDVEMALDVAFSFKLADAIRLARALEPFNMMWLEAETFDFGALRALREQTSTPLCIGESLFGTAQFKPLLETYAVSIIMPDLAWNAVTMGKRIADLAHAYDVLYAPHNCHSPLTTLISAQVSAAIPNFFRLELDVDDVPWRDDILTHPFVIERGALLVPDRPGLGADLIEEELLAHPAKTYTTR